jgi:hypothetical protein
MCRVLCCQHTLAIVWDRWVPVCLLMDGLVAETCWPIAGAKRSRALKSLPGHHLSGSDSSDLFKVKVSRPTVGLTTALHINTTSVGFLLKPVCENTTPAAAADGDQHVGEKLAARCSAAVCNGTVPFQLSPAAAHSTARLSGDQVSDQQQQQSSSSDGSSGAGPAGTLNVAVAF